MKLLNILFSIVLLTFCSSNIFSQERFVKPFDGASQNASFKIFRDNLLKAAKKRDVNYILSIVDGNIKNSFGGNDGFKNFKSNWKLESPKSPFWEEFTTVLSNGGAFYSEAESRGTFCAPYPFMRFPSDLDVFEYSTIFGKDVNLRAEPRTDAPIVGSLSYNVVKIDANTGENPDWTKVETLGGLKGYVFSKYVRSSIAYRACFEKVKGKWKMTAFIAGD